MTGYVWLIPVFPLIGFLINGLFGRKLPRKAIGIIGSGAILLSFLLACVLFVQMNGSAEFSEHGIRNVLFPWISYGDFNVNFAYLFDRLSGSMTLMVAGVSFLIHVYSIGYMAEEDGYWRYFAYLNLFVFMMLTLVLADNLLLMFVGWEGVGLCSYLLIGFYYTTKVASDAGKKAFIVNRVGDFGFILGMFLIFTLFGSLEFTKIREAIVSAGLKPEHTLGLITLATILLFVGATGKSAQIPLYIWLPDAMAGPTPVSALIHAATMVTSGVYMIVKLNFLFQLAPITLLTIAWVGGLTALFAATIGTVQNDIKKVLAYSTVSQLGYMFLALGVGAFIAGFFHILTHAFFKALLFLGSGSVIHAMHHAFHHAGIHDKDPQDIRNMGGLKKYMPKTYWTFLIATLAIAGFPPFAGFFSKDEILWKAFASNHKILWGIGAFAAVLTSFYMFRLVYLTFLGDFRGTKNEEEALHESPSVMTVPLMALAFLSVVGGWLGFPHIFHLPNLLEHYLEPMVENIGHIHFMHNVSMEWTLMFVSVGLAIIGWLFAKFLYGRKTDAPEKLANTFNYFYKILLNKYYVDEIYFALVVTPVRKIGEFCWLFIDTVIIDGAVNLSAYLARCVGKIYSLYQNGAVKVYALTMLAGILILFWIFL
ncbi:NADH-quinone oxidoreductase subunit L [Thermotomaculum hydrothermale]|uniref:NADH-quinone oxidoreductase subunit L n=1 Tax=Thermotomaculum hydrothermale TaxID=981385 RepID=A0A7R6PU86_9BACT|nr:NADH-quinone oxidoreductase subunit L [Thermotomaculum hydrothermale]BBB32772.1 NADH-quinone oxidoreductase subunit L [Thermotomaculum hydrothermale]